MFSPGDWSLLRAAVLAVGAEVVDEGDGERHAHLEWGDGPLGENLTLGLSPERCAVVRTGGERYVAAELAGEVVAA